MVESTNPAAFFASHRSTIREAALRGGGPAVVELIEALQEFPERLILYTLARQALVIAAPVRDGLDAAISVADAGLEEVEDRLRAAPDMTDRQNLLRALHMLNFNLAADLADCWPGDEQPRERRHFERGLKAADRLLSPIFAGAVTPHVLANDHWVRGMHQLSLGDARNADRSWAAAVRHAVETATRAGAPSRGKDAPLQVLVLRGYRSISSRRRARPDRWSRIEVGERIYQTSVRHLEARHLEARAASGSDAEAAEAKFFIEQLEKVQRKYLRSGE